MISSSDLTNLMRSVCSALQVPVIIILLVITAITIVILGTVVVEIVAERRYLKIWMPQLVSELRKGEEPVEESIRKSGLLKRHKMYLIELARHTELTERMRESLALRLLEEVKARYDTIVKCSELIVKLGPVFGLLGTLIPLGPGIIALGQGDTYTLSQSLLTAFDTTILGLGSAAVATVISTVRKKWYANDISILETLMECILEVEKENA